VEGDWKDLRWSITAAIWEAVFAERAACLEALIKADGRQDAIDAIRARGQ